MRKLRSFLWWLFAVLFTLVIANYQKRTGPTYPIRGTAQLSGKNYSFSLIRSAENGSDAKISVPIPDTSIKGKMIFKRYKSFDTLTSVEMKRSLDTNYTMSFGNLMALITGKPRTFTVENCLVAFLPKQPAAGKMMYSIELESQGQKTTLQAKNNEMVVMRFKGHVPYYILIPHILCMFLGLLFSTRTAIEALINGARTYKMAIWTLVFLTIGGLLLGPVVQKYAFGAYWTGWPFGHDLTDNKTLVMVLLWVFAALKLRKDPTNKVWPVIAAILVLVVYLIPHSMLGSEIDHTKAPKP